MRIRCAFDAHQGAHVKAPIVCSTGMTNVYSLRAVMMQCNRRVMNVHGEKLNTITTHFNVDFCTL